MRTRFLLGPSGAGKTFRCVAEARAALSRSPEGRPLVFLAPRQATFQLERQILQDPELAGFTRLQILSFERLANYILEQFSETPPQLLTAEARVMVLRALLTRNRAELQLFRATARMRGFAEKLSVILSEFQRHGCSPDQLLTLASRPEIAPPLSHKLHDFGRMLQAYLDWLRDHDVQDQDQLLPAATETLRRLRPPAQSPPLSFSALWMDGFAELTPQEMDFLAAFLPWVEQSTLAFNLDRAALGPISWLNSWSLIGQTFQRLHHRLSGEPNACLHVEWLDRSSPAHRFAENPVLRHLETHWCDPIPFVPTPIAEPVAAPPLAPNRAIRILACANPEMEAARAARAILRHVQAGGRFREISILTRNLEGYHDPVRRALTAFGIPFFLDRREPVAHHPLSELTRAALRTAAHGWLREDWFGALKTGLVHADESDIDRLENEALAQGWDGEQWRQPLKVDPSRPPDPWLETLRRKLTAPFINLASKLAKGPAAITNHPTGAQVRDALLAFWQELRVDEQLAQWTANSGSAVHLTLWEQMREWVENLALAFSHEALPLRDWLPIIESGLSAMTVGVIPPGLDQVLIGALDRTRNTDLRLAIVLGLNESVFPAVPEGGDLITEFDRQQLALEGLPLGPNARERMGQERYLGYIACTRARDQLLLTYSLRDGRDKPLNPSPFLAHLKRLFPDLAEEPAPDPKTQWLDCSHASELLGPLLQLAQAPSAPAWSQALLQLPAFDRLREHIQRNQATADPNLLPELAEGLHGATLETSVSRLEEFAACPFKFFVTSGLKAEERKLFELDVKEQGTFKHELLARFHADLTAQGKRWRDLTPQESRDAIARIAAELQASYRQGLLEDTDQSRFTARALVASLQTFIETVIAWMNQYKFDPAAVELAFGMEQQLIPAWEISLDDGHRLSFKGKIDRIDLCRNPGADEALCVVMDYKSSEKKLDPVLCHHGIQLQLPAYLNVLRACSPAHAKSIFGVSRLVPGGVFYVNLRGRYEPAPHRRNALQDPENTRKRAYQHSGKFDESILRRLDNRPETLRGDQFNYRLKQDGAPAKNSNDVATSDQFLELLDAVERNLRRMGNAIFAGIAEPAPYRKGALSACDQCAYLPICRIDPWTQSYRVLTKETRPES